MGFLSPTLLMVFSVCLLGTDGLITDEALAAQWLDEYNEAAQQMYFQSVSASWNYNTNITDYNKEIQLNASLRESEFSKETFKNASLFDWRNFKNETLKKMFKDLSNIGIAALDDKAKVKEYNQVVVDMKTLYSTGKFCMEGNCYQLEPDLTRILRTSRDPEELLRVWKGWRDATGPKIRPLYQRFVELSNEGARANGFKDTAEDWRARYETPNFEAELERLYEELGPLYDNLHAYVRRKLMERYGKDLFPPTGHIPAHLLGNMWAQSWDNIMDIVEPYKGKVSVDVTSEMVRQNYTAKKMFEISDEFFTSLGLIPMPEPFWNKSMIEKPEGREVVCHASAWDFYNQKDFRIKQCTVVTMGDLVTVHHEMGHIQYDLQYKNQPVIFRDGANPGFHEAVGDVLALSVSTPGHLKKIGLLAEVENDAESDINFLMSMALDKIAFLPFGFLMDQWRWKVFSGETSPSHYNRDWWALRCKYQGIAPPVARSEEDFDPGAKYHIPANTPYIRYFVSYVIQFQFHKALCAAANQTGPLHKCDIYRSKAAGDKLGAMLQLGSSKPWQDAMEAVTGQRKMDATAIVDYFKPLIDWLKEQNKGHDIGWMPVCPTFTSGATRAVSLSFSLYAIVYAVVVVMFSKVRHL
ncbi:angiotensin-converting enzyme-like isoform X1 [Lineus longissimus]|uniref:angiotensin-converting enzyme-like isoform X1 n=1 Tax=Lineus longissimus TaxID=88925 RepID=UPI002B4C4771